MKVLIERIRKNEKYHYFYGYPRKERLEIIKSLSDTFEHDVVEFPPSWNWGQIISHKGKIKIIRRVDKILDKHDFGGTFRKMKEEGASYVLFSNETFKNTARQQEWFEFMQTSLDFKIYSWTKPPDIDERIEITTPAKQDDKKNGKIAFVVIASIIFVVLSIVYGFMVYYEDRLIDKYPNFKLVKSIIAVLDIFVGLSVLRYFKNLKKRFEEFIDKRKKLKAR